MQRHPNDTVERLWPGATDPTNPRFVPLELRDVVADIPADIETTPTPGAVHDRRDDPHRRPPQGDDDQPVDRTRRPRNGARLAEVPVGRPPARRATAGRRTGRPRRPPLHLRRLPARSAPPASATSTPGRADSPATSECPHAESALPSSNVSPSTVSPPRGSSTDTPGPRSPPPCSNGVHRDPARIQRPVPGSGTSRRPCPATARRPKRGRLGRCRVHGPDRIPDSRRRPPARRAPWRKLRRCATRRHRRLAGVLASTPPCRARC